MARDVNNRGITEKLYITEKTVERHLVSIFARMGVRTRVEATRGAFRRRRVSLKDIPQEGKRKEVAKANTEEALRARPRIF